jgi:hypothetical protein
MPKSTRRQFTVLAAAALPLAAALDSHAQNAKPEEKPPSKWAEALTAVVRAEFDPYLTAEDVPHIRGDFESLEASIKRLREFPLVNSDEPDLTFTVRAKR